MPQPGELIHGKYRILKQLADGGMGTIYEARHEVLGTSVALKMLHPNLAKRTNLVERFLQEARVSATLRSPHIVQVIDVEQGPQGAILVMELLRGETLQAVLDREHKLDMSTALNYALQILAGLEVAHAANVVHRDLKPDNVFLVQGPSGPILKLLDFGIAKLKTSSEFDRGLTKPGVVMGTPEYMAPEQAYSADTVDARADIYAMGVLLFEMLSGQRPVRGDDPKAIAQKVFAGHVTALSALLPSLPIGLVSVVHRAMAPAPKGRFSSVGELRQALLPFVPPPTRNTTPPPSAVASTSVLNPTRLPTNPASAQPNPGSMPSTPPNGLATPPLSPAAPQGPSPPVYPPSPSSYLSQPSYPSASPAPSTGAPAPLWPASPGVVPTVLPEPHGFGATEARPPLP
ncbi:MAG: protein kinase, partial [Myxococcales bacterium]|nr:protein kinase [Myxococcales bacterium]